MTTSGSARPSRRIRPFTPSQESAAELSDRTVGRDETLQILIDRLVSAATSGNRAHSILVGPRGSGKTHVLNVAIHRAQQRPEVRQRLRFVRLDEDAVGITRYSDILQEVLSALSPSRSGSRRTALPFNPEEAIAEALGDQVLVLVIENLDRIFHVFSEGGQQDFRSWVENSRQVMVLATTPLLFPGISDRALPWWGNFGISHLEELNVEQGRELLIRLAQESGDTALAEFLATDKGVARLRAINALAGGSPRIWMILSECLTVESLDELVPAVEALLEGLVPYYQQLLWDLSPVEQRLVRELADGPQQAATVAELAKAAGIEQRVAASTLGRLADIRWVRSEKVPGLDKRSSWYRLREPMLRHHFHYRSATDQPLPLIVEILRAWYDPDERRRHLSHAEPGSVMERFAAASLRTELNRSDIAYVDRNVSSLQVEARTWVHGAAVESRTPQAGSLVDIAVMSILRGAAEARESIRKRQLDAVTGQVAEVVVQHASTQDRANPAADRAAELLRVAARLTTGRTHDVLVLLSASWDRQLDPQGTATRLRALAVLDRPDDRLLLDVRQELAWCAGWAGDAASARDQLVELVADRQRVCGPDDRDTLATRQSLALFTGQVGDAASARDQLVELVADRQRVCGPDDRDTLLAREELAWFTGQAGDAASARDQYVALVADYLRVLGPDDRDTLGTRRRLAWFTSQQGDAVSARDDSVTLLAEYVRVFGPDHPDTLLARQELAWLTGQAGDAISARDQSVALVAEYVRVFGPEDFLTLSSQLLCAMNHGESGDPSTAVEQARLLLNRLESRYPDLKAHAQDVMRLNVQKLLLSDGATSQDGVNNPSAELGATLQAAIAGSAEALVRLPSELVEIVESLRASSEKVDSS
jgi:hypothetical protein